MIDGSSFDLAQGPTHKSPLKKLVPIVATYGGMVDVCNLEAQNIGYVVLVTRISCLTA